MSVSSIARNALICHQCTFKMDPAAISTIHARQAETRTLIQFHFCSAVCWTEWLGAVTPDEWVNMILPPLTDDYEIRDVQRALAPRRVRKVAA